MAPKRKKRCGNCAHWSAATRTFGRCEWVPPWPDWAVQVITQHYHDRGMWDKDGEGCPQFKEREDGKADPR